MTSILRYCVLLITTGLIITLPVMTVWSADEDIGSSVYLVFDPETGEFVQEVDPDIVKKDRLDYEIGRASGLMDHPPTLTTAVPASVQDAEVPAVADEESVNMSAIWISSIIALGLVGGFIVFRI